MKIPGEKANDGYDRLEFYRQVTKDCFYSRTSRIEQYDMLKNYYLFGCEQGGEGTPYNKIGPIVDTLTAFLYSADSTRFSAHLGPEVPEVEWTKVPAITKAVNAEWMNSNADRIFDHALEWATVYNSTFVKQIPKGAHIAPYVVEPHCLGVYREDINGLDRQEAIAHRYYITRSQLEAELENHPQRAEILQQMAPKPIQARDEMPEGLRRIIVTNSIGAGPITPGGRTTGNATLWAVDRLNYDPGVSANVIEMTELWVRDDETHGDYRTVTMAEGEVVIYDRPNIFVPNEQPFTQVCPVPMEGYFWGRSFVGSMIGLQSWRNIRIDEIQRMLALQASPPHALTGWTGLVDELSFALNQPAGVLNSSDPMGKVERFDLKVPPDLWSDVQQIDEMFMEAVGLPPILMGRGETGVRSGKQTSELSRLGSSRTKKRALCIEDSLETMATKMFKAMRRYDDDKYTTVGLPNHPPMKFILKQSPEDLIVKVDGHSNSPLFVEDQKQLSFEMLEVHMIDRESAIEMLNPPMKDMLLKKLPIMEAAEKAAAQEKMQHELQMKATAQPGMNGAAH